MRRAHVRRLVLLGLLPMLAGSAGGAGCAKARAETQPQMPALEAPPPPPHVFAAAEAEALPSVPVTTTEEEVPAARTPQRPPPARTEPRVAPPARTERETEPAKSEDARPARTLQTPESGSDSERAIRDQLTRASADLQRVDYRSLSASLREQYDVAKRFIQQAEDALKAKNLVYAATLAGKAFEIAQVLPRR